MERFERHYTPKHGSWKDMAEIEIGVLCRQALSHYPYTERMQYYKCVQIFPLIGFTGILCRHCGEKTNQ